MLYKSFAGYSLQLGIKMSFLHEFPQKYYILITMRFTHVEKYQYILEMLYKRQIYGTKS